MNTTIDIFYLNYIFLSKTFQESKEYSFSDIIESSCLNLQLWIDIYKQTV